VSEHPGLSESQQADYERFKRYVYRITGIDLGLYRAQQMHRRLLGLVERANLKTFAEYAQCLERDPEELAVFLDRMTINVSELFRNPDKWEELRDKVLPPMVQNATRSGRRLRVWSAGCSYGAEPYSLAMILDQLTPGQRHTLLATDIDQGTLAKARNGVYTPADIKNVPPTCRQRYLVKHGSDFQVVSSLRERILFRGHNLLSDPFEEAFDLIVCRNVVIYFTDDAKDRLFMRFRDALRSGGVLFLGGTERIHNYRELGLQVQMPFFYTKQ